MSALNPTMRVGEQIAEEARAHKILEEGARRKRSECSKDGLHEPERRYPLIPRQELSAV